MKPEKRKIKFSGNLVGATAEIHYQSLGGVGHSGSGPYHGKVDSRTLVIKNLL